MRARWILLISLSGVAGCNAPFSTTEYNRLRGDAYALDTVDRAAPADGGLSCHPEGLVLYRGTKIKLQPPSSVAEAFKARLERFENVVAELGERTYGRGPSQLLHAGTYACRPVGHRPQNLSEHALGNAIDVTGFRFPPLARTPSDAGAPVPRPTDLPKNLEAAFVVTVARDFTVRGKETEVTRHHARFFQLLTLALRERDLFRGVIGPPDPSHETHLHLDMAPWSYNRL